MDDFILGDSEEEQEESERGILESDVNSIGLESMTKERTTTHMNRKEFNTSQDSNNEHNESRSNLIEQ